MPRGRISAVIVGNEIELPRQAVDLSLSKCSAQVTRRGCDVPLDGEQAAGGGAVPAR